VRAGGVGSLSPPRRGGDSGDSIRTVSSVRRSPIWRITASVWR